ncbi:MAG: hypothetical protein IPP83_03890 [Flavobacteriales bacterium]|nr:hypothetical protein [Flavobacteriales bacterium]
MEFSREGFDPYAFIMGEQQPNIKDMSHPIIIAYLKKEGALDKDNARTVVQIAEAVGWELENVAMNVRIALDQQVLNADNRQAVRQNWRAMAVQGKEEIEKWRRDTYGPVKVWLGDAEVAAIKDQEHRNAMLKALQDIAMTPRVAFREIIMDRVHGK